MASYDGSSGSRTKSKIGFILLLGLLGGALLQNGCAGLAGANQSGGGGGSQTLSVSSLSTSGVTQSGATVDWQTNLPATSQIEYGTSVSYGSTTALDASLVTNHQQGMSGLKSATLYHFRVHSKDSNNSEAVSADMTVTTTAAPDTTAPTVSISSPAPNATLSGTVTVSATASDNVGVVGVQFKVDGNNIGAEDSSSPYSASLNTTTLSNGNHTLTAVARDAAGNTTTSAGVTVNVSNTTPDTTPPAVSITAPASGSTVSGTITVSATASDNVGVAGVQFKLDGNNLGAEDTSSPYSASFNTTIASNGNHSLTAVARDAAGNRTTSAAVTVNVNNAPTADTTPPSVPTGLSALAASSSQINLTWNASTDNVGVTGYKIFRGGSQIATSTTTSYSNTGLSASTSYSYTVAAYDAAGNTSAQSSSATATTFSSSGGGGIPSTLGWFQIPNTQMNTVCPPDYDCAKVIIPWSGGVGDTTRNRLIVWGGGHSDYPGNEVYALDLNALTINRLNDPSPSAGSCVEVLSDGKPPSRHTYDGLAYMANVDRMVSFDGSMAPTGCASEATWTLSPGTLVWQNMNPGGTAPLPNGGVAASAYDPNTGKAFVHTTTYGQFASYDFATNRYALLSTFQGVDYYVTAAVDSKRRFFFMFGAGGAYKIDISGSDATYSLRTLAASGCSFKGSDAPGVAYDPVQDRIVGWSGGNTVYLYNPDTDSCTSVTYPNGPGAQQLLGTYGRFRYFPSLGVFALVNNAAQNAYTLRLTPGSGSTSGPAISAVAAPSITTNSATITWTTDVGSTSQVEYGTTTAYGTLTTLNSTLVTAHTVLLSGLSTGTLYHYRVHSKNSSGFESISGDFAFSTNNTTDTTPPTVSVTSPAAASTVSGTVSVTATATDNVGVASVQFLLDGANLGSPVTAAPYSVSWNTISATNGSHTLDAQARDVAGNVGNAVSVSVNVSNSGSSSPDADFQARCTAPGVLRCAGWDAAADFTPADAGGGYASGLYAAEDGTYQGKMDTSIKTSGGGALRFDIRAGTVHPLGSNPTGYWRANFGPDNNVTKFGPHMTLYFQFRLRLDSNMLNYDWTQVSATGWKVFIAFGPIPGPSCTGAQFVQENSYQTNVATGYTSCGSPPLYTNGGNPPMLIEQGDYNCQYVSSGGYASDPNCFTYPADTWLTEYWVVETGDYGQANSHFTAYIAPQGQSLKKFIDLLNFRFDSGADPADALMELILQPYFSGAFGATSNPSGTMWFDELIISNQPIAAPKF